jgi:hypothetical protein
VCVPAVPTHARGVRRSYVALRVGATVKLGQSSRSLTLMGDTDPMREDPNAATAATAREEARAAALEQRAAARAERIAQQTGRSTVSANDLHEAGAGWGFDAEAEMEAEADEEAHYSGAGFEQLVATAKDKGLSNNAKQERLFEQLEKRAPLSREGERRPYLPQSQPAHAPRAAPTTVVWRACAGNGKMANLQQEMERIAAKEIDGLSEGQTRQVERNASRLKELEEQVPNRPVSPHLSSSLLISARRISSLVPVLSPPLSSRLLP